jgi:hypothetical protein
MTQTLADAIRRRITFWTLQLATTPPGSARRPIYAVIKDLERLLKMI